MLSFWTFSLTGERIAFSVATTVDANVEDALIKGWLWYAIPFDQWRIYTIAARERRTLEKLGLLQQYQKAQTSVAAVL